MDPHPALSDDATWRKCGEEIVLRPHPDVVARILGEEVFLVHLSRGTVFRLNQTGKMVWDQLAAARSPAEIIEYMHTYYGISADRLSPDLHVILGDMLRNGLIEKCAETTSCGV
jgi:hypothetical protein